MKNSNDWHKKEIERLDRILIQEKELKRMLARLWDDHERWLRKHEVR